MISLYNRNILIGKIYENIKILNNEYNNFIINESDKKINEEVIKIINDSKETKQMGLENLYFYLCNVNIVLNNKILFKFLNPLYDIKK